MTCPSSCSVALRYLVRLHMGYPRTFPPAPELTGNCREGVLPNIKIKLSYATTVDSGFYEKDFSQGLGIVPDVIIPLPMARKFTDNIDEWVLWVAEDLKR